MIDVINYVNNVQLFMPVRYQCWERLSGRGRVREIPYYAIPLVSRPTVQNNDIVLNFTGMDAYSAIRSCCTFHCRTFRRNYISGNKSKSRDQSNIYKMIVQKERSALRSVFGVQMCTLCLCDCSLNRVAKRYCIRKINTDFKTRAQQNKM